ncbi:MAG: cytochrome c biogenesis protein ResB [Muribaculaceae bacterium]|nr:cytochrome c biogenesis protein ResB [Muribaculaceae bacterium]
MWRKPWSFKEGFAIGFGLLATGLLLQFSIGTINWQLTAWPVNGVLLVALLLLILAGHLLRGKAYVFAWLGQYVAAISAMTFTVGVTVVLGLIAQSSALEASWWNRLLSSWPFVLIYLWLTMSLGLTILRVASRRWTWRTAAFMLNHVGLFVAIVAATLGNADMHRLNMTVGKKALDYGPQAMAYDQARPDAPVEMDFALELNDFVIDEYPAKLAVIDSLGQTLPVGHAQTLVVDSVNSCGALLDYDIRVDEIIERGAKLSVQAAGDSTRFTAKYVPLQLDRQNAIQEGGAYAVRVTAVNRQSGDSVGGWVSCGSFLPFSFSVLPVDDSRSIAMLQREPRRYASYVRVYVRQGDDAVCLGDTVIEVNRPISVNGWKIYQLSYEEELGAASRYTVLELVRDPWLPAVYVGIFMMLAGALTLFVTSAPKSRKP